VAIDTKPANTDNKHMNNTPTPPNPGSVMATNLPPVLAPIQKQSLFSDKKFLIIVIAAVVIVVGTLVALFVLNNNSSGGAGSVGATAYQRLRTLETIRKDYSISLKSQKAKDLNAVFASTLGSTNVGFANYFTTLGIDTKNIPAEVARNEANRLNISLRELEDARLNDRLDQVYARIVGEELSAIATLFTQLYNKSDSASFKDFASRTISEFTSLSEQFANL